MSEAVLRAALVRRLRDVTPYVVLRHEDLYTAGHPDLSVTGHGHTVWVEVKKDALTWKRKIQQDTLLHLGESGLAIAVVYTKNGVEIFRHDGVCVAKFDGRGVAVHDRVVDFIRSTLRGDGA